MCCISLSCGVAQVLQLEPASDAKSIKGAVRNLARKVHPDKCSLPGAAEAFKAVVEAAEHLSTSDTGLQTPHLPTAQAGLLSGLQRLVKLQFSNDAAMVLHVCQGGNA